MEALPLNDLVYDYLLRKDKKTAKSFKKTTDAKVRESRREGKKAVL